MRQVANNTFNGGLMMDMQPLTTPNTVLTDCLNGTLITYDGNEFVLQSDDGNGKVKGCILPKDYIPLGMKEYGGIIYIASKNPFTGECQIGSFPSPEQLIENDSELDLDSNINANTFYKNNILSLDPIILELGETDTVLRPGDKFLIIESPESENTIRTICQSYDENGNLSKRNIIRAKLLRIGKSGNSEDVSEIVSKDVFEDNSIFWLSKTKYEEIKENPENLRPYLTIYTNKINGYLLMSFEVEQVDDFGLSLTTDSRSQEDEYNLHVYYTASTTHNCKNNITGFKLEINSAENTYYIDNYDSTQDPKDLEIFNERISDSSFPNLNLFKDTNYKITITPYSNYLLFNNLKYETNLNYFNFNNTRQSYSWKYYFDKSMDTDTIPDRMRISFDFIVRNTLNQRGKVDYLYLEFYDVIADTSLYYPITSITDSRTIQIDCFNTVEEKVSYNLDLYGNNVTTSEPYYALIDASEKVAYEQAIENNNFSSLINKSNELKNILKVVELQSFFNSSKRYNNLGDNNKQNNKLRSNNFYLVAICGLDFYKSENDIIEYKQYYTVNTLWTNGIFNKYFNVGDITDFNLIEYPEFYQFKIKSNGDWEDNTSILDVDDLTESGNLTTNTNSYITWNNPAILKSSVDSTYNLIKEGFKTRLRLSGDYSREYTLNAEYNDSLNYGDLNLSATIQSIFNSTSENTNSNINEEDNLYPEDPDLSTDSVLKNIQINKDLTGSDVLEVGKTINNTNILKFSITTNIQSDRKIYGDLGSSEYNYPKYEAEKFSERYPNTDVFPYSEGMFLLTPNGGDPSSDKNTNTTSLFFQIYQGEYTEDIAGEKFTSFNSNNKIFEGEDSFDYNSKKLIDQADKLNKASLIRIFIKRYRGGYHGSEHRKPGFLLCSEDSILIKRNADTITPVTRQLTPYSNTRNWINNGIASDWKQYNREQGTNKYIEKLNTSGENAEDTANFAQYFIFIPTKNGGDGFFIAPVNYDVASGKFSNLVTALNTKIQSLYFTKVESNNYEDFYIASNIKASNNFNTTINLDFNLASLLLQYANINIKTSSNSSISLNTLISEKLSNIYSNTSKIFIGNEYLKSINNILSIPNITLKNIDINYIDTYSISSNKFTTSILNFGTLNLSGITNILKSPQAYIPDNDISDSLYTETLFATEEDAKQPSLTKASEVRYNTTKGLYFNTTTSLGNLYAFQSESEKTNQSGILISLRVCKESQNIFRLSSEDVLQGKILNGDLNQMT